MKTKTEIEWAPSLEEALGRAKEQEKPVYVDFYSPT